MRLLAEKNKHSDERYEQRLIRGVERRVDEDSVCCRNAQDTLRRAGRSMMRRSASATSRRARRTSAGVTFKSARISEPRAGVILIFAFFRAFAAIS
ncbi:MAG TPA: hypothetical protein VGF48_18615 [Thermoanaerobaculia bacterium]